MPFEPPPGQSCSNCLCFEANGWHGGHIGWSSEPASDGSYAVFAQGDACWLSGKPEHTPWGEVKYCGSWLPSRELNCGMCGLYGEPECPRTALAPGFTLRATQDARSRACRSFERKADA